MDGKKITVLVVEPEKKPLVLRKLRSQSKKNSPKISANFKGQGF